MTKTNHVFKLGKDDKDAVVSIRPSALTKHCAFLGASGSGKTTAALNVIEQAARSGIPVIIIDRKGDLSGYGGFPDLPPSKRGPWEDFYQKVEPVIYTPGHPSGRGLQLRLAPEGLDEMDATDQGNALNMAAHALGDMLGYKEKGSDAQKRAIIFQALLLMMNVRTGTGEKWEINLRNLITYIAKKSEPFINQISLLDLENVQKIVQDLSTFSLDKGRILTQKGEDMTMDNLLNIRKDADGNVLENPRTRISIISTKFLGAATLFFVAQLFIEASRWASKNPSNTLQAMLFVDEADIYMPARGSAATKDPLLNLLKRGRSAGLSVGLATQSPGEMDYQGRNNVDTWFIGKIREKRALDKVEPMVAEPELMHDIPFLNVGEFMLVTGTTVTRLRGDPSLMHTAQLSEDQILALARAGSPSLATIQAKIRERKALEG